MPVLFWGADGAEKYYNSYFARFDGKSPVLVYPGEVNWP
jgi:hypothetical protein